MEKHENLEEFFSFDLNINLEIAHDYIFSRTELWQKVELANNEGKKFMKVPELNGQCFTSVCNSGEKPIFQDAIIIAQDVVGASETNNNNLLLFVTCTPEEALSLY